MRNLFEDWQEDEDIKFPYGLAKLKQAFQYLENNSTLEYCGQNRAKLVYWRTGKVD